MNLSLELQQERPTLCITENEHGEECRTETTIVCASCGWGVCVGCLLPCYQCGEPLHDHCRDEHANETGHRIDL